MIAVVIPSYRVREKILNVIKLIGPEVTKIFIIDDKCPEKTGEFVEKNCTDIRVKVIFHKKNKGVGGATKTGFKETLKYGDIKYIVKVDGDGQIDPRLINKIIHPLKNDFADYAKGNRFYVLEYLSSMPMIRLFGNSVLSFLIKLMTGYWNIMDPTNGFVAINKKILSILPFDKIDDRYFFESDMLFRLSSIRAVVHDIPMCSVYQDEKSSMNIKKMALIFPFKITKRFLKRIIYNYILRDFNSGSIQLILGLILTTFGLVFGIIKIAHYVPYNIQAPTGTVMMASIPIILGVQLFISFINFDTQNRPTGPVSKSIYDE